MIYADYDFYTNEYHGMAVPADDWLRYALIASAHIDRITFARLKNGAEVTDDVRMAVCAVADVLRRQHAEEASHQAGIKSENVDGYSVTYDSADTMKKRWSADIINAASLFLPPSDPLRFAGVYDDL